MASARPSHVEQEARRLVERLGGAWTAGGGMCRCPAHEDRTPSLSVRPGRVRLLLHCFAGCAARDILKALQAQGLLGAGSCAPPSRPAGERGQRPARAAQRIWAGARSIAGTPAADYLEARGLRAHSPQLRFHPRTPHGPAPSTRFRPALVAAVRGPSGLVAIHRTFIERPAPGLPPRAVGRSALGALGVGAVRLGGSARRLALAEGIETALSVSLLFGLPCWATLGAGRFASICLPPDLEELLLFPDRDPAGRRAERAARAAFAHIPRIEAHYPGRSGQDWNDMLCASPSAGP